MKLFNMITELIWNDGQKERLSMWNVIQLILSLKYLMVNEFFLISPPFFFKKKFSFFFQLQRLAVLEEW